MHITVSLLYELVGFRGNIARYAERVGFTSEPRHEISNNMVCATSKGSDQPAHTRSLIRVFAGRLNIFMSLKLLTEHHLEFLSLKEGCTCLSESTLDKMPHCWKSHVMAHLTQRYIIKFYLGCNGEILSTFKLNMFR